MPITNTQAVAGILYAETYELQPAPNGNGPDKASLSALRKAVAQEIAATANGEGFAAAAPPPTQSLADPEVYEAWVDCVAAAKEGVAAPAVARAAAFIDDQDPTKDRNRLREYPWLARQAAPPIGRADWLGIPVSLYLVRPGPGIAPGRYPPLEHPRETVAIPGIQPRWLAALLFLAAVALLLLPAVWAFEDSKHAIRRLARAEQVYGAALARIDDVTKACAAVIAAERMACERERYAKLVPTGGSITTLFDENREALTARSTAVKPNLTASYFITTLGVIVLMALISWGLRREVWGFLVDERPRMSLSRFQFVSWTVVILSAYLIAAMWNIGIGAELPRMQPELWGLLGIVTVSPLASTLILDTRGRTEPGTPAAGTANWTGPGSTARTRLEEAAEGRRGVLALPPQWSFLDLFTGEEIGNQTTVDISRVQQFVFTLVTLFAFVAATQTEILTGVEAGKPISAMPVLGASIVGLLAVSHFAYLGAKALPKAA